MGVGHMKRINIPSGENKVHRRGVSVRRLNYILAGITLVISVLLLFATYRARVGYKEMRSYTENYIHWQKDAYDMQIASDYLTEQVRCFAESGEQVYLNNYFREVEVERRRDNALEHVREYLGETEAYRALEDAMRESNLLMEREFYAMRLMVEAMGYPVEMFPEAIRAVSLSKPEAAMAAEVKKDLARRVVFDQTYRDRKTEISAHTDRCISAIAAQVERQEVVTADQLDRLLNQQRILIIVLIVVTIITMLLTLFLVISPLLRAVVYIRAEQPIPITGSYEFQFLARTYNLMYEANREQKEHLAYQATHDELTGAYNRSGYEFLMKNLDLSTAALLVVDLDKFKTINDTYGHDAGDKALFKTAETLRSSFRSQDYVCRIGGDEFTVIMVHVKPAAGEMIREKLKRINEILQDPREEGLPALSVSCGVAFGTPSVNEEQLFLMADEVLYEVKRSGGCGCRISGQE